MTAGIFTCEVSPWTAPVVALITGPFAWLLCRIVDAWRGGVQPSIVDELERAL